MQFLRFSWRFLLFLVCANICGFFLILSASYLYLGPKLPPAEQITKVQFQTPLRIYTADRKLIAEFGTKRRIPLRYQQLPPLLIKSFLAAEDDRFFQHGAVDYIGLLRAAFQLVRYQEIRSGGSTITMQVARNFFLSLNQTFLRKFNEIVLAIQIEHLLTKEEILALYLNKIFLGKHAYGVASAAEIYYGKPLDKLTLAQMAMLAGLPKAPSTRNPIDGPRSALQRRNWILSRMQMLGYINKQQYMLASAQPVTASYHSVTPVVNAGYVAELARQQVLGLLGDDAYTSGISVYTTIDSDNQQAAVAAVRQGLQNYDMRHGWRGPKAHLSIDDLPPLTHVSSKSTTDAARKLQVSDASRIWAKRLADYADVANLKVALVAKVGDKSALAVLKNARLVHLNWEAMEWANPYHSADYRGHAPDSAHDVLQAGDVIYLLAKNHQDKQTQWRVAKVPTIQGALVSLDPHSGAILAMQGGYDFGLSHFNRATQAMRQPGSSFKPYVYTSALLNGMTTATLLNDAPIVFNSGDPEHIWRPTGAGSNFFGQVRLRFALYESLNLASIRLLQRIGIDTAFSTLRQLRLPVSRFPKNLSVVLGSVAMTPMQMATGYSTFANSGYHIRPWLIKRIVSSKGKVIWQAPKVILCDKPGDKTGNKAYPSCPPVGQRPPEAIASGGKLAPLKTQANPEEVVPVFRYRVLDRRVAWLMYSIMQDVIDKGTGRRAKSLHYDGLAGKTGTTDRQIDAWFVGYSPDVVTAVWTGFDQPSTLGGYEQGAVTALPIWIDYMRVALPPEPIHRLPEPAGISAVLINRDTGLRAYPGEPNTMFEYFRSNKVPPFGERQQQGDALTPQGIF